MNQSECSINSKHNHTINMPNQLYHLLHGSINHNMSFHPRISTPFEKGDRLASDLYARNISPSKMIDSDLSTALGQLNEACQGCIQANDYARFNFVSKEAENIMAEMKRRRED